MAASWLLLGCLLLSNLVQGGQAERRAPGSGVGRLRGGASSPSIMSRPMSRQASMTHLHTGPGFKYTGQSKMSVVEFAVRCSETVPGELIAMMGKGKTLGEWRDPIPMKCDDTWPLWQVKVKLPEDDDIEYKYVKIDEEDKQILQWEDGEDRYIYLSPGSLREALHVDDGQFGIVSKPIYTVSVLVRVRVESV